MTSLQSPRRTLRRQAPLAALDHLYDRLATDPSYLVPPAGYSPQKIAFKVVLTPNGDLFAIQDAREIVDGKPRPQQLLVPGGAKPPGIAITPGFLWDNAAYMLGHRPDDPKPARTAAAFAAFRARHLGVESDIDSAGFPAVCRFLASWDPAQASDHPALVEVGTGFGVFQIQGRTQYVHEEPPVAAWWRAQQGSDDVEAIEGQCLVTGRWARLARIHDKVKGVAGAQSSGASLVSFQDPAYRSYGREQSYNAPVSEEVAFRYVAALNALLDGPRRDRHRLRLGDMTVAFWTDPPSPLEDVLARWAIEGISDEMAAQDEGLRQRLQIFLEALRRGRKAYADLDADATSFYLLGLSPNAARLSIRFFYQGSLGQLLEVLRRHTGHVSIERQYGEGSKTPQPEIPSLQQMLDQTCPRRAGRPDREKIPPILAGSLLQALLTGSRYPDALCGAILRRIAADGDVNFFRASAIKGWLVRNRNQEVSMSLDRERADPPYRLGRLFAVLEKTQVDALGRDLSASIRDRFYSSASATPRIVFPRLLRTYGHHLAKLETGRKIHRERLVQEILDPLGDFPAHLDLEGQGLFAIGYYHQTRDFYRKVERDASDNAAAHEEEEGDESA